MKVAIIYNRDMTGVINTFGMQNKEIYNPKTVKLVAESLESGGHNVAIIDGNMNVVENLQSFLPKVIDGEHMGMVFNMAYGIQGESRYTHIPSLLEMLGIPYVGSTPSGHALALDKVITKVIMQKHNIPTPEFWVFSTEHDDMSKVIYPVIVKPKMESVSFGLRVVYNQKELKEAVAFIISEFKQQALVEQFIRGREFAVGIIGNSPIETFPVLEVDLEGDPDAIQTVEDKKVKPRRKVCPAMITPELAKKMQAYSVAAFQALQLRDFSRVDIRLDENGNIYLLEINSMASLGQSGSYVYAAQAYGLSYKKLVNKMLQVAVKRYFSDEELLAEDTTEKQKTLSVRVRSYLRNRTDYSEKLLAQFVNTNTHVRNIEGVNHLGIIVRKLLASLDFGYQMFPQVEVGNMIFFTNTDEQNYEILFLANLDNSVKISKHQYFSVAEQKYMGTGVWENKGGIVSLILALQALKYVRVLKKKKIGILLTTDDNLQGKYGMDIIHQKTDRAKNIISLHGSNLNGALISSRSGAAVYKCSMNLKEPESAIQVAKSVSVFSKLISSWTELTNEEEGLVISPSNLELNSNITESYAHAELNLSVRFNKNGSMDKIDRKIRKLIPSKNKKNMVFQIEGGERRPAFEYTEKVDELWNTIKKIANQLDIRIGKEHRWSSSNLAFVSPQKARIDGFGPTGNKEHGKIEYINKYSLTERAALIALVINELN